MTGSNNTAELTAIGEALVWLINYCKEIKAKKRELNFGQVIVRYDSVYAAKSITGEYNGKKNVQLISRIRELYRDALTELVEISKYITVMNWNPSIAFKHVRGHSDSYWNNCCDSLAKLGISFESRPMSLLLETTQSDTSEKLVEKRITVKTKHRNMLLFADGFFKGISLTFLRVKFIYGMF